MNALDRAPEMWAGLTRTPAPLPRPGEVRVVLSPESGLCPPDRAGVLVQGGGVLCTAPTPALVEALRGRPAGENVRAVPPDHADVLALLGSVPAVEAAECGLDEVRSEMYVLRDGPEVVTAAVADAPASGLLPQWRARVASPGLWASASTASSSACAPPVTAGLARDGGGEPGPSRRGTWARRNAPGRAGSRGC
ncbi:hypothetical protein ACU635_56855 [[Actinomadura] parvosata]|uniref:hypothetical protein n=1 Tax=[Actinomadura] parvosata TaxID=1955412 RepID=UPI00406BE73C